MLRRLRDRCTRRIRLEGGFTLIELLVTIMIIGILAAIAIPAYTEHKKRAEDTEAKENARNLANQVEFCFAPNEDFQLCDTRAELDDEIGVSWGNGPGQTRVTGATRTSYTVEAVSKAKTSGANHVFTLERNINGSASRTCSAGSGNKGGCNDGKW